MPELKILLALQHISDDAQQWKENEKTDLDDACITMTYSIRQNPMYIGVPSMIISHH